MAKRATITSALNADTSGILTYGSPNWEDYINDLSLGLYERAASAEEALSCPKPFRESDFRTVQWIVVYIHCKKVHVIDDKAEIIRLCGNLNVHC